MMVHGLNGEKNKNKSNSDGSDPQKHYGSINSPIYKNSTLIFEDYKTFLQAKKNKFNVPYYGRISTYTTEVLKKLYLISINQNLQF